MQGGNMSLQLILGSSGSGKSHQLYQEIIEKSMEYKDTNYLVVVPEQFTMQTQKDLVTMHPNHGVMNIDILSFMRLAYRVFEEVQVKDRLVLDDTGKSMILRKVVAGKKKELQIFQTNVKKQGFVGELKSMLSEIYQYSISTEKLAEMITKTQNKPTLQRKLSDMLVIYEGFKEYLSEKYITAEEILDVLCDVVEKSKLIQDSVICFDGFTGFTPSQYKLLGLLMRVAKKVLVTVTIDEREDIKVLDEEYRLFHLSKKTILKLYQIAEEEQVTIDLPCYAKKVKAPLSEKTMVPYRYRQSPALAALEHTLFRYPLQEFTEAQEDISIHKAKDAKMEVNYTVKEILRLVREENYRFKDIAVVTGDLESYGKKIEHEYSQAKIPCFIDLKKDILSNPLVELIRSLLEVFMKDFSYESVFRYLRCGLVGLNTSDIDMMENYVMAIGIRGFQRWNEEWSRTYLAVEETYFVKLNELREQVIKELLPLRDALKQKDATVHDYTKALYQYLVKSQVAEKIEEYRLGFEEQNNPLLVKEYKQIYQVVMELLDKVVDLLGQEIMSVKEFKDLLDAGFEETKVGLIPPGIDQVVVGDIERTRLNDIKVLFFIGVNDGVIPKTGGQGGIISDMERELLASYDLLLAPTRRQNAFTEQFYLYLNLTKPTNKLYLTFSKVGTSGKSLRVSYLVGKLQQIFPGLMVIDEDEKEENNVFNPINPMNNLTDILGVNQGLDYMIKGLREYQRDEMSVVWKELFGWYSSRDDFREELQQLISAACYVNDERGISKAVATVLYGNELTNSVTRLEKYAACAFAHFLSYGLELKERQEYKISIPDLGSIFHTAMELFSKKLGRSEYSWRDVTKEARDEIVTECVREATLNYNNTILLSSKRNEYMITRVERIMKRTVWALCEHVKHGDFIPSGFELQFSHMDQLESVNISLNEEEHMRLMGRIDRVDLCEKEDELYVRVIDYKSGNTSFDIAKLYHGLQLQLVVYLSAALELEQQQYPTKIVIPAGIFYYNIDDPIVVKQLDEAKQELEATKGDTVSKDWEAKIEKSILKELKMNGLVNADMKVIAAMDTDFVNEGGKIRGSVHSQIIPVETNKEGLLGKRSSTITSQDFTKLRHFVQSKIKEYGTGILEGKTDLNPYKLGEQTACDYCEYSAVCGFDKHLFGNEYRKLSKFKNDEVWDLLHQDNDKEVPDKKRGDR